MIVANIYIVLTVIFRIIPKNGIKFIGFSSIAEIEIIWNESIVVSDRFVRFIYKYIYYKYYKDMNMEYKNLIKYLEIKIINFFI